jgi:hypothetical protein
MAASLEEVPSVVGHQQKRSKIKMKSKRKKRSKSKRKSRSRTGRQDRS